MLLRMDEIENDPTSPAEGDEPREGAESLPGADGAEGSEEPYEDDAFEGEEFSVLNRQLDQLQSALDDIESRNDNIHKVLLEILQSNREVRKDLSKENKNEGEGSKEDGVSTEGVAAVFDKALMLSEESDALTGLVKTVTDQIDEL